MRKILYLAAIWLLASSFTTIRLMGDSTCADKDLKGGTNPERGWGMMFRNFVDDSYRVVNYAQNGRSTKSFIDLGLWDKVQSELREGDWLFIQFGHNDAKQSDSARYAAPWGAYQDNLRMFVHTYGHDLVGLLHAFQRGNGAVVVSGILHRNLPDSIADAAIVVPGVAPHRHDGGLGKRCRYAQQNKNQGINFLHFRFVFVITVISTW